MYQNSYCRDSLRVASAQVSLTIIMIDKGINSSMHIVPIFLGHESPHHDREQTPPPKSRPSCKGGLRWKSLWEAKMYTFRNYPPPNSVFPGKTKSYIALLVPIISWSRSTFGCFMAACVPAARPLSVPTIKTKN